MNNGQPDYNMPGGNPHTHYNTDNSTAAWQRDDAQHIQDNANWLTANAAGPVDVEMVDEDGNVWSSVGHGQSTVGRELENGQHGQHSSDKKRAVASPAIIQIDDVGLFTFDSTNFSLTLLQLREKTTLFQEKAKLAAREKREAQAELAKAKHEIAELYGMMVCIPVHFTSHRLTLFRNTNGKRWKKRWETGARSSS